MQTSLKVEHLTKKYGSHKVLDDINFELHPGEFVCLLGPSGCGKSTLLRMISGLDTPTEGRVWFNDRDVTNLPAEKRNFGIVFQSYALFPNLTAYENVAYSLKNHHVPKDQIRKTVMHYLDMVGLADAGDRYPAQLSGGEQQRIALSRALTMEPDILLLDEPLSALDAKVRARLRREICRIQRQLQLTTIMVTHDQQEAMTMADRIIVMDRAKLMQDGTPEDIYNHPNCRFVADFIGDVNFYGIGNEVSAIRPECIRISELPAGADVKAVLTDIEFHGNFYRVAVRPEQPAMDQELFVDVPVGRLKEMKLQVGSEVYMDFPQRNVLHFER